MALGNVFNNTRCWLVPWKCDRWFKMLGVWLASWISPYMQFHHDIYKPYSRYICIYLKPCFHHFTCSRLLVFDCFHLFIWSHCQFISFLNDFFQNSMLKLDHITESQHQNNPDILRTKPSTIPRTLTTWPLIIKA